jgi:outer membrane lipoprotein-sorting protein
MLAVGAMLIAAGQTRADDDPAVKELLGKAAKAIGGADKTAKLKNISFKGKGQVTEGGNTAELSFDFSIQEFDRVRAELKIMAGGQTHEGVMVMNSDNVFFKDADRNKVEELPKEVAPVVRQFYLAMRLPSNPAALSGSKEFQLGHGGEAKVDDTPAVILRVSRKDRPDIDIYYDTKTYLPLKAESQIKGPNESEEKKYEFKFSDFKEVDGVKHYGKIKIVRDGKDMIEMELSDAKFVDKFDAGTFAKPQ